MSLQIRSLEGHDEALRDVITQSFGFPTGSWADFVRRIGAENFRVARLDGEVIGGLGIYRMGQWWGGRRVDVAGYAAVGIGSAWRGEGYGAELMKHSLSELYEHGEPLAALYPSTLGFYRQLGFEQAGYRVGYEMDLSLLPRMKRPCPMRRIEEGHFTELSAIQRQHGQRINGTLARTVGLWERVQRTRGDEQIWTWILGDDEGYVVASKSTPGDEGALQLRDQVALTADAARTIWAFAAQYRTMAETLRWYGGPADPLLFHAPVYNGISTHWQLRWLIRVIRVEEALTARGYPTGLEAEVGFKVDDPLLGGNSGRWTLSLSDGHAEVHPGATRAIDLDIATLSALYSGIHSASELHRMGRLAGDAVDIARADLVFSGYMAFMTEMF